MAYDRWGMTVNRARDVTGVDTLDDAALQAAEEELAEILGWRPSPDDYSTIVDDDGIHTDVRVDGYGKAVAWQAAYRTEHPASADDDPTVVTNERIAEWSAGYARPKIADPILAPRARRLLARGGWLARRLTTHSRP